MALGRRWRNGSLLQRFPNCLELVEDLLRLIETEIVFADPQKRRRSGKFGLSLCRRPLMTVGGALGNRDLLSFWDKWKPVRIAVGGVWTLFFGPDALANVRHLIGEPDLHRQECIGRILDHFRAGKGRGEQRH